MTSRALAWTLFGFLCCALGLWLMISAAFPPIGGVGLCAAYVAFAMANREKERGGKDRWRDE